MDLEEGNGTTVVIYGLYIQHHPFVFSPEYYIIGKEASDHHKFH